MIKNGKSGKHPVFPVSFRMTGNIRKIAIRVIPRTNDGAGRKLC